MKNLLTNSISTTVGFPVKSGTLDFLQTASSEMLNALGRSIIGKDFLTTTPYALYGCNNTTAGGLGTLYTIQEGAILWNGVLYLCAGGIFTLPSGSTAYLTKYTSYAISSVADPVIFTDGVSRNVHQDTTMLVGYSAIAPSPTAGFAYSSLEFAIQPNAKGLSPTTNYAGSQLYYYRNRDGVIMLDGYIQSNASAGTLQTIATFPVGYRPAINQVFSANKKDTAGNVLPVILRIKSTGEMEIYAGTTFAAFDTIPLTGLQFTNYI